MILVKQVRPGFRLRLPLRGAVPPDDDRVLAAIWQRLAPPDVRAVALELAVEGVAR